MKRRAACCPVFVVAVILLSPAATARRPVAIPPGQPIQAVVDRHPAGTAFLLKSGVHRLQSIIPKDRDSFTGEPNAVLSGATLLASFSRSGRYWVASAPGQQVSEHGNCQKGYEGCSYSQDLFIDSVPLRHVTSLKDVVPGSWFLDYAPRRIYLADDPTGHTVEIGTTPEAFGGAASGVNISHLVIEKYASPAQSGAVNGDKTTGWTIRDCELRLNHGVGLRVGSRMQVVGNRVHDNGQLGIGGVGDDVLVEGNEIAHNNFAHFDPEWEAGGAKFVRTNRLIVRRNFSHHNLGPGLWTDIDNADTIYDGNTVEDNDRAGIFHEISYAAVIRGNTVRRNGFGKRAWLWGAGILVAASPNVEVVDNTVENNANGIAAIQQRRGTGAAGPHEVANLWVHGNRVTMTQGRTGLVQDVGDESYYTRRRNRFDSNAYRLGVNPDYFAWMDRLLTERQWQAYGQDTTGTFTRRR